MMHPVLAFNHSHLGEQESESNLWVSVNTDDVSVFDTSLSIEFALLFDAIFRKRYGEDRRNDDAIYEYLDVLRQNGIDMAFKDYEQENLQNKRAHAIRAGVKHWWESD